MLFYRLARLHPSVLGRHFHAIFFLRSATVAQYSKSLMIVRLECPIFGESREGNIVVPKRLLLLNNLSFFKPINRRLKHALK
jgi:hypothetical protein